LLTRDRATQLLWDAITAKKIADLGQGEPGDDAAFSPDGSKLAIARGQSLYLLDASTGAPLAESSLGGGLRRVAYSPDGRRFAATCWTDGVVHLYDGTTGKKLAALRDHSQPVKDMVFSSDGAHL